MLQTEGLLHLLSLQEIQQLSLSSGNETPVICLPYLHPLLYVETQDKYKMVSINTLRPRQNGRHFPDDIFKCIFLTENV